MTGWVVPEGVRAEPDGNGDLVLLNIDTGRWHKLNRVGSAVFGVLRETTDVEQAVEFLTGRYPDVPTQRIRDDVTGLVADLVHRGLLEPEPGLRRRTAAVLMTPPAPSRSVGVRQRVAAMAAFVLALVLLRLPFRTTISLVRRFRGMLARRDASAAEALEALAAAHSVSRFYLGRVACLELSLTAVLTGALGRRGIDWCLGTAVDPQTFHAWIEVEGNPVTDAADEPIPPSYRRVLLV